MTSKVLRKIEPYGKNVEVRESELHYDYQIIVECTF